MIYSAFTDGLCGTSFELGYNIFLQNCYSSCQSPAMLASLVHYYNGCPEFIFSIYMLPFWTIQSFRTVKMSLRLLMVIVTMPQPHYLYLLCYMCNIRMNLFIKVAEDEEKERKRRKRKG